MFARKLNVVAAGVVSLSACVGEVLPSESESTGDAELDIAMSSAPLYGTSLQVDPRRSLAITDQPILERFSFERVMNQLVAQARVPGLTATKLFQQWWDTQNPIELATTDGPHCNDIVEGNVSTLNGFPYTCRPAPLAEGKQASCDPFTDAACKYIPIGLFNRFDLAPTDGSSCGEYRIVYAKETGKTNVRDRNLLIFEASLPNPRPWLGIEGCRPIVSYWAELSRVEDVNERARRLDKFYFKGFGSYLPAVVDIRNFGDNELGRGQVRTNQFVQDGLETRVWSLREFKLEKRCESSRRGREKKKNCSITFVPVTNKTNPFGGLFTPEPSHPKGADFQDAFLGQIENLSATSLADIKLEVDDRFNSAQSQAQGTDTDYLFHFEEGGEFGLEIEDRLADMNSTLEPIDIVARAQTQSCAGCHRLSNGRDLGAGLTWPSSLGFTHVSERETEVVSGITRFLISDALTTTLLPHRKTVMEEFLRGTDKPCRKRGEGRSRRHRQHETLGGSQTHG